MACSGKGLLPWPFPACGGKLGPQSTGQLHPAGALLQVSLVLMTATIKVVTQSVPGRGKHGGSIAIALGCWGAGAHEIVEPGPASRTVVVFQFSRVAG